MIVVTLVCCYAACWGPTKRRGVVDTCCYVLLRSGAPVEDAGLVESALPMFDVKTAMPLVVGFTPFKMRYRRYYFWFFGYVAKLPYERDIKPVVNGVSGAT